MKLREFDMKNALRNFVLKACSVILLAACASGPKIQTDYDTSVDFSSFKTYGFFKPMGIEGENYSTIFGATFRTAISREMEARGYVQSNAPDLLFNVSAQLQEKVQVSQYSSPGAYGYYGYRSGYYAPWGGYGWNTHMSASTPRYR
jgi:hypothetical protein